MTDTGKLLWILRTTVVLALLALSSCKFFGLNTKVSGDESIQAGQCFRAHVYALPEHEQKAVVESLQYVCGVFQDPVYRERLQAQSGWIAHPAEAPADVVPVSGKQMMEAVADARFAPIHYFSAPAWSASATSARSPNRISFKSGRISQWSRANPAAALSADYLNTVAHELTHFASDEGGHLRFTDAEKETFCARTHLASYRFGDLMECHVQHPTKADEVAFGICMATVSLPDDEVRECGQLSGDARDDCMEALFQQTADCTAKLFPTGAPPG